LVGLHRHLRSVFSQVDALVLSQVAAAVCQKIEVGLNDLVLAKV
jgi:hypothetical protein